MRVILNFVSLFCVLHSFSQDVQRIKIKVNVPNDADEVYIAGNQESIGSWDPGKIKMKKISSLERTIEIEVKLPIEFKFTRGSWESIGITGTYRSNPNLKIEEKTDKDYTYAISTWTDEITKDSFNSEYRIERLTSQHLNEQRILKIYVPENYSETKKYPVFYVTDAHYSPNFEIALSYLKQLHLFNVIPECILVGINQKRRNNELDIYWNREGAKFKKFLFEEVIPFINENYTTSGFNTLIGHSNGATYNHLIMTQKDNPFQGFINMSEYFPQNQLSETATFLKNYDKDRKLYFFVSSGTLDAPNRTGSGKDIDSIMQRTKNEKLELTHKTYEANHNNLVAKSLLDGIQHVFSDYYHLNGFDEESEVSNSEQHPVKIWEDHTKTIKTSYGIDLEMSQDDFYFLRYKAMKAKNKTLYREVVDAFPKHYNQSEKEYYSFEAQAYEFMGFYDEALAFWKTNLSKNKATNNTFYYRRPYQLLYNKMKKPKEAIEFLEYSIEKYPKGALTFNYYIVKSVIESKIEKKKGRKALKYLENNYKQNNYFKQEELKTFAKQIRAL